VTPLNVLCAGAVKGLVVALQPTFERAADARIQATFGAVGAMRDALRGGAPCDVLVVSEAMIDALLASGELRAGSHMQVGRVQTALAVKAGAPRPTIDDSDLLKAALLGASALYVPDITLSTAGAHVASVLGRLGVRAALAPRLRMFANGATAMAELARAADERALGCTQATEIRYTPGIDLVGALPPPFMLATVYSAAIATAAENEVLARSFIELLAGTQSRDLRVAGGFDPVAERP
jgi:molybdate transport system substrate-binding protein